ncbi:tetratricopeptide repeat protein [Helicobacter suis]|uniref:tetratricopeptide repeat protein n=1 Tax=Helicobacter suis TaxID=104628 RepID=UPI0013D5004E|nr:tetratricopeptide repeat protein [Helicobacter suis]
MLKSVLRVALVGALCLGSIQAEGKGEQYLSMSAKAYQNKDYQKALAYSQKAASMGITGAYFNLGIMYENGYGVAKDYQKALEYYKKAASMGDADAYAILGAMYENGEGVARDYQKALEYFKKACKLGDKDACNNEMILK